MSNRFKKETKKNNEMKMINIKLRRMLYAQFSETTRRGYANSNTAHKKIEKKIEFLQKTLDIKV